MSQENYKMTCSDFPGFGDPQSNLVIFGGYRLKDSRSLDFEGCIWTWEEYRDCCNWIGTEYANCGGC
jgi:hypothetical protein